MKTLLKTHFGYDQFRPLQEEIITNVLAGKDSFVLMPTGGGKSLCYQLPALKLPGLTLVISPLIALMKDQVDALKANGIAAEFINSSLSSQEIHAIQEKAKSGELKILYLAPERLASAGFQDFLQTLNLSLIAIDEAHCISEWGHDFRPDYRNLKLLKKTFPQISIIALTATATPRVQTDITQQLTLDDAGTFVSSFDRPNLNFLVWRKRNTFEKLLQLLERHKNESVIIYCFSRKETENVAADLQAEGFKALPYHAGLSSEKREQTQDLFIKDEIQIIVATIAFGMGIDKPDIRLVVHYTFPKTLEGYYQEVGRAGRDNLPSECVLFYSFGDRIKHEYFIEKITDAAEQQQSRQKLNQVINYCELQACRRKHLLSYFGEKFLKDNCEGCNFCLSKQDDFDATEIAQKILSCVIRTGNRFGANYIIDVLRGSGSQQIARSQHDRLSVFGIVSDFSNDALKHAVQSLLGLNYLQKAEGKYPTLSVAPAGLLFLKNKESLKLPKYQQDDLDSKIEKQAQGNLEYDAQLFEKLRALRKQLADEKSVPPFVIFGDVSLREMAYYFPKDRERFSRIEGVGTKKLEAFSEVFLNVINQHVAENGLESKEIPDRRQRRGASAQRKVKRVYSNYGKTKEMIQRKISLNAIAEAEGFQQGTIVSHIEKLLAAGEELDIEYLCPPKEIFEKIKAAFIKCECEDERMKPVFEFLNEEFSYGEIRLVRIFTKRG